MYLRCPAESNPVWNGNRRVLFQNNNNQNPANTVTRIRSTQCVENLSTDTRQTTATTHPIPTRMTHRGQVFFIASKVPMPPAMAFPQQGIFAADARAAWCQTDPAIDASQLSSLRTISGPAVKLSQSA